MSPQPAKQFLVIAYDIVCNRRRNRIVKLLKGYGRRANYSVFECRIRKKELKELKEEILAIINAKEDSVLYYPLCRACVDRREEEGFRGKKKRQNNNLII